MKYVKPNELIKMLTVPMYPVSQSSPVSPTP